jgi:hypothetical protein
MAKSVHPEIKRQFESDSSRSALFRKFLEVGEDMDQLVTMVQQELESSRTVDNLFGAHRETSRHFPVKRWVLRGLCPCAVPCLLLPGL